MKQSLQLKLGQQLTMTPQLQQAIKLLQLSTLDLQLEIQQALESNPLLEVNEDEPDKTPSNGEDQNNLAETADKNIETNKQENELTAATEAADGDWNEQIPEELPVDSVWDDIYPNQSSGPAPVGDDENQLETRNSSATGLQDHLLEQLNVLNLSDLDRLIGFNIIEGINPDGSLSITLEDVLQSLQPEYEELELDEIAAVLTLVQQFDPPGVAARDLGECLVLQLKQLDEATPWRDESIKVVEQHLALLGNRDYNQLMRRSKLKEHELKDVIQLIQSLNPRPGSQIEPSDTEYIIPDVFVRKQSGRWLVELNPDTAPKLRVNNSYASLVKRADNSADNTYLRNHLQEARWFIKSLQSRNETLLKVASQIVERQRNFLEYGAEAMKPLVLHDIADAVDMHESTISRVTTQKYMHTPRGIFELKYFFSSHVSTTSGGEVSSTAIRALIKKLCDAENPKKPLSDSKISQILAEQNIKVARRTVAKYRDSLLIPPSNERKRLV